MIDSTTFSHAVDRASHSIFSGGLNFNDLTDWCSEVGSRMEMRAAPRTGRRARALLVWAARASDACGLLSGP